MFRGVSLNIHHPPFPNPLRSHRTDRPGTSGRTHAPFRLFSCPPPPLLFHVLLVQVSVITLSQSLFWKAVGYPEFVTSRGEIIITRPHSSISVANAFLFFKSNSVVIIIHALTPGCLEFSPTASNPHKSTASSCVRSAHIFLLLRNMSSLIARLPPA